ncbi:hypothetical protein SAMN05216326_10148 [Nitrosomonas marina]|uniref:DUF4174 domain-containing protein n=1 Tax=Nitrosomonas marina TaxID=917 RepID=A0A1H9Y4J1_9PROT|nr:hypothetical protein [Nitrosomonas marina]SES63280.1 hypothetical protein SAMN05216326_10148 [Nitrosomonas marina]
MPNKKIKQPAVKQSKWPKFVTLTLILVIVFFAVSLLPRGFSGDTSLIGQGTPVLLLVHDDNILQSGETMAAMNAIRDDYAERLAFIVADINTPEGRTFTDRHGLMPAGLVFFSADGDRLQTLYTPQTPESLRLELSKLFQY